jgi:Holliday junction resolvase
MTGAAERGRKFEAEVAELFRAGGFRVDIDPGMAKPRQTDLCARTEGIDLLIEVKNRRRKVEVGDVDALRSRLSRTAADIVGVIFTTSGLSREAIKAIETDRRREVLVFVKEEIDLLHTGGQNLRALIERKRQELRVQGKVWLGPLSRSEYLRVKLPTSDVEFRMAKRTQPFFASMAERSHASYVLDIPHSGWGILEGEGARLSLRLTLSTIQDLQNILGFLHEKFGLSTSGMFSIHQANVCWYGVGAENFMRAAECWRDRYSENRSSTVHHSESLNYFDEFRNGWVLLSSQQRVHWQSGRVSRASFFHQSELVVQLPGVPVDMSPYLELCRYTGNNWAHFEFITRDLTHTHRLKRPIVLNILGDVVNTLDYAYQDRVVIGVIAENPFFGKQSLPTELQCGGVSHLRDLLKTELLMCAVRDWHDDGDVIDRYALEGFDAMQANGTQVIRPFGTWNRIIKRARPQQADPPARAADILAEVRGLGFRTPGEEAGLARFDRRQH